MNGDRTGELAIRITERLLAVPGVRGVFPQQALAAALTAVTSRSSSASGVVTVALDDGTATVTARLATDQRVPAAEVIAAAREAIVLELRDLAPTVRIELAHIE